MLLLLFCVYFIVLHLVFKYLKHFCCLHLAFKSHEYISSHQITPKHLNYYFVLSQLYGICVHLYRCSGYLSLLLIFQFVFCCFMFSFVQISLMTNWFWCKFRMETYCLFVLLVFLAWLSFCFLVVFLVFCFLFYFIQILNGEI